MTAVLVKGNIFNSSCDVLVNPVNTVGIMGKGLALQFKAYSPTMFTYYQSMCDVGKVKIGEILWWKHSDDRKTIANFPTKQHWRNPSQLDWIKQGLKSLHKELIELDAESVAMPKLGCGLGKLDFSDVLALIDTEFEDSNIRVEVYI